jgi:hypothetical protein
MYNRRTSDLHDQLKRLYERLNGIEKAKIDARDEDKIPLQHRIDDSWGEIREKEDEYIRSLVHEAERQTLPESVAKIIVDDLVHEIDLMSSSITNASIESSLQKILVELKKPHLSASAKLKITFPIIPGIVTYEIEGDTESLVRRLFPTFEKFHNALKSHSGK